MDNPISSYARELLQNGVHHPEWQIRFAAAEALVDTGDLSAVAIVQEGLQNEQAIVRDRAVTSLGKCKRAEFGQALIGVLQDRDIMVRGHALEALALSCGAQSLAQVQAALGDHNEFVQNSAVVALGHLGEQGESLLSAVARGERGLQLRYTIRLTAAACLASRKLEEGLTVLRESLDCGDSWVAFLAARHLASFGDHSGEPLLRKMLQQGNWPEKISAIESLLHLGVQEALAGAMYRENNMPDMATQVDAIRLLDRFAPEKTASLLGKVLKSGEDHVKIRALEVIGELKKAELMPLADDILQKGPEHLRATAVMSLEKIDDPALLPMLQPVLEKAHWLVRFQAARVAIKLAAKH